MVIKNADTSDHYKNFRGLYEGATTGSQHQIEQMKGVFLAAMDDYRGGYLFSVQKEISGELFGDFVSLAKTSLDEGYKDVAAVLACAALEDTLKRYALLKGIDVDNRDMAQVINALKAQGLVKAAQKTLLDTMPKIRDYAMHANWDKIAPPDVRSVIGYVEQFLLTHFA